MARFGARNPALLRGFFFPVALTFVEQSIKLAKFQLGTFGEAFIGHALVYACDLLQGIEMSPT